MKSILKTLITASFSLLSLTVQAEDIAVTGGTAFTNGGKGKVENATILISAGKIVSVTPNGAVPEGYRTVDAMGKWITAGFMVADSTLGLGEIGMSADNDDARAAKAEDGISLDVAYSLNPANAIIANTRIEGVTRALTRFSGTKDNWRGMGAVIHLGSGNLIARNPAVLSIDLDESAAADTGGSRSSMWAALITKLDAAKAEAGKKKSDKKDKEDQPSPSDKVLADVLAGKIPLMVTAHRVSDIQNVIALKAKYGIRVILSGAREGWLLANEIAAAGIPVVMDPVLNLPDRFDQLASTGAGAGRLQAAGVKIAFSGPDNFNSRLVAQHAGNAVAMGLSWEAAIDALTVNPAEIFGVANSYGTLVPGKDADVVVWDGDPLEVMTSPDAVFIKGEEIPLVSRQTLLRDRYKDIPRAPALKH